MKVSAKEIKDKLTCWDLLQALGYDVKPRRGAIKSPYRKDNKPSFSIFDDGVAWKDFATGAGGDVFSLYADIFGLSLQDKATFAQVKGELAKFAGLEDDDMPPVIHEPKHVESKVEHLYKFAKQKMKEIANAIREQQVSAMQDLHETGSASTMFFATLRRKGFNVDDMIFLLKEGCVTAGYNGKLYYVMDHGLKMRGDFESSRSDRWVFGSASMNLLYAKNVSSPKKVIFCEGETDALAAACVVRDLDYPARVIGCMGANTIPDTNVLYKAVYDCNDCTIIFDADQAGETGAYKLSNKLEDMGKDVTIIQWPQELKGADVCEIFKKDRKMLASILKLK